MSGRRVGHFAEQRRIEDRGHVELDDHRSSSSTEPGDDAVANAANSIPAIMYCSAGRMRALSSTSAVRRTRPRCRAAPPRSGPLRSGGRSGRSCSVRRPGRRDAAFVQERIDGRVGSTDRVQFGQLEIGGDHGVADLQRSFLAVGRAVDADVGTGGRPGDHDVVDRLGGLTGERGGDGLVDRSGVGELGPLTCIAGKVGRSARAVTEDRGTPRIGEVHRGGRPWSCRRWPGRPVRRADRRRS